MLVSVGRAALVEGIGLEAAGVQFDRKGIGDRRPPADERAAHLRRRRLRRATGSSRTPRSARARSRRRTRCGHEAAIGSPAVPRPIYTDPEIAGVGLTEAQAKERYGDENVAVGRAPWAAIARAVMSGDTTGWVKTIHETTYGELLGIVIVGPHATDLIDAGVVALDAESTIETVADGIAPHPTFSEAIKEAGLVALGRAIHLPPRRKATA